MNKVTTRTPNQIAAEINHIKNETQKVVIYNSIEIGRKLSEAKELVPHGKWLKWLDTEVSYKKSTADNLIRIFKEYGADQISLLGDNLKSQAFGNLNYSQAILLLGVPGEDREKFIEENDIDDMSTRELKKAIADLKKSEEDKEEALKERDAAKEEIEKILKEKEALEEAFNLGAEERQAIEDKNKELEDSIEKLEIEIKEKSQMTTEIKVETSDVDIELENQIEELKQERDLLKRQVLKNKNALEGLTSAYKIHFNNITKAFEEVLNIIAQMKETNEVESIKYKKATERFLDSMMQRL
ncbi:MAG: DUF3102 domain-containing protein [Clostridium sp.]|uniref:DUF3102 domain-containing protein n=1 Tax=Clostridium sp. TaxID=1506 RepID=UPI003F30D094